MLLFVYHLDQSSFNNVMLLIFVINKPVYKHSTKKNHYNKLIYILLSKIFNINLVFVKKYTLLKIIYLHYLLTINLKHKIYYLKNVK